MESNVDVKCSIKEKYLKVKTLLRTKDPDNEPYKSCYEAKEILFEMLDILEKNRSKEAELYIKEIARIAGVYYLVGTIFMSTEESASAEEYLFKCYMMIEMEACQPDNVLCATACLNQIGLLYAHITKHEEALVYLDKAVRIYNNYKANSADKEPVTLGIMYAETPSNTDKNGTIILERTYTLTLYYLAQVYTGLDNREKGALYCHETLRRQIESNDYKHIEWAINAATMSQVFIEKYAFKEARHHLAAAMYILDEYEKTLQIEDESTTAEAREALYEELNHRRSDVLRCWVKYCLVLFSFSRDRLMCDDEDEEASVSKQPPKELLGLSFPTLNNCLKENEIGCDPILTFDDARPIFLFGQKCCNEATNYYTLTEYATDYTNITMDHSQLYNCLSFFEEDDDRKCKILKRRLDLLTNVENALNPDYYLDICREIWLSLGEICSDMAAIKISKIRLTGSSKPNQVNKVNNLVESGVKYYNYFMDSFKDKRTNELPEKYPKDHEQSIILAHLQAARLYSKSIYPDKQKSVEIDKIVLKYYQTIVKYSKSHKHVAEEMASEVQIANDMLVLLPYKISRLTALND